MHWARWSPVHISIIVPSNNHACKYREVWWKQVILFFLHVTTQYGIKIETERLQNCWGSRVPGRRSLVVWFKPPSPHFSYRATHLGHRPLVRSTFIIRTPPPPPISGPGYRPVSQIILAGCASKEYVLRHMGCSELRWCSECKNYASYVSDRDLTSNEADDTACSTRSIVNGGGD